MSENNWRHDKLDMQFMFDVSRNINDAINDVNNTWQCRNLFSAASLIIVLSVDINN